MTWLAVIPWLFGVTAPVPAPSPAVHPQHLSTAQFAIEERVGYLRVRMFKHDVEEALAASHGLDSVNLEPTPAVDSLFLEYFVERYEVHLGGVAVRPTLISSGEDFGTDEGEERIWWVLLEYRSATPIRTLDLRARILFEWFEDQRNVVRVLHAASEQQQTIYFAAPDDEWAKLTFP